MSITVGARGRNRRLTARKIALRLTTLATVAGMTAAAVTAAAATGAAAGSTAAGSAPPLSYQGSAASDGLLLLLTPPSQIASLPSLPLPGADLSKGLSLGLVHAEGALSHDATGRSADVASSKASFGTGVLFTSLLDRLGLNTSVLADLAHPGTHTAPGLAAGQIPARQNVTVARTQLPSLTATALPTPLSTTINNTGVGLTAAKLSDLIPASQLQPLITMVSQQLTGGSATLSQQVGSILGQLPAGTPADKLRAALSSLQAQLTALDGVVNGSLANLENGALIDISGLQSDHSLQRVGQQEVSTVHAHLAKLSLLGGLITLDGFDNRLTTYAGGTAGSAKVVPQPNAAVVKIGNVLSAVIGPNGLKVDTSALNAVLTTLGAGAVPPGLAQALTQLDAGLATLNAGLNGLLNVAGISITQDKVAAQKVAADGSAASAALSGLEIRVAQPGGQAPLLDVLIGRLQAASGARPAAAAGPAVLAAPAPTTGTLAYTGAQFPLTGTIALLAIGLGVAVLAGRRRWMRG